MAEPGAWTDQPVRRRRRRRSGRRTLMLVLAVCAPLVILPPLGHYLGWFRPRHPEIWTRLRISDLELSELVLEGDGPGRHVAGMLRNVSGRPHDNVELKIGMRDAAGQFVGIVTTTVVKVGPHSAMPFWTGAVPEAVARVSLLEPPDTSPTVKY